MAEQPDVSSGEISSAAYHNALRDRTLQRYLNVTDRDFLNPAPVAGDMAYLANIDATQVFDGAVWSTLALGANYLPLTGGTMVGELRLDDGLRITNTSAKGSIIFGTTPLGDAGEGTHMLMWSNVAGAVSREPWTGPYLPLAGGTTTGDVLFDGGAQVVGVGTPGWGAAIVRNIIRNTVVPVDGEGSHGDIYVQYQV